MLLIFSYNYTHLKQPGSTAKPEEEVGGVCVGGKGAQKEHSLCTHYRSTIGYVCAYIYIYIYIYIHTVVAKRLEH